MRKKSTQGATGRRRTEPSNQRVKGTAPSDPHGRSLGAAHGGVPDHRHGQKRRDFTWPGVRNGVSHPGVRKHEELSRGERAADHMRNTMGSWPFVFCFFGVMILWAVLNSGFHVGGGKGYDPYPYILLNLFLSMLAGVQAAALLIAAKRQDQVSSEIAVHTEKNTDDIKTLLEQNTELTQAIEKLT